MKVIFVLRAYGKVILDSTSVFSFSVRSLLWCQLISFLQ